MDWETLRSSCLACTRCELCKTRTNVVFGQGVEDAEVLFVGEGPGQNEDEQGLPFVGRSGQLLDKYLFAIDLDRTKNCYIANIVKCRPPQNRDPQPAESEACMPWLREQFRLLQPKIVVCLGRIAAQRMIRKDFSVTKEHGQLYEKGGILFMGTFHPAALLRSPQNKPAAFADFTALRDNIETVCKHTYHKTESFPLQEPNTFLLHTLKQKRGVRLWKLHDMIPLISFWVPQRLPVSRAILNRCAANPVCRCTDQKRAGLRQIHPDEAACPCCRTAGRTDAAHPLRQRPGQSGRRDPARAAQGHRGCHCAPCGGAGCSRCGRSGGELYHTIDAEKLHQCTDEVKALFARNALRRSRAARYIASAGSLLLDSRRAEACSANFEKVRRYVKRLCTRLLPRTEDIGSEELRLLSPSPPRVKCFTRALHRRWRTGLSCSGMTTARCPACCWS